MSLPIRLKDDIEQYITIKINNTYHKVSSHEVPINTSLNTFIRCHAKLPGTKFMCQQGGCGACIVVVEEKDPVTKINKSFPVNSCLMNIWSCYGMSITTIEGAKDLNFGNSNATLPDQLASYHGTQCGYCSPGMVMTMCGLMKSKGSNLTEKDIEDGFGGNICRCTGYRPILNAFRSLVNPSIATTSNHIDIEDCASIINCPMRKPNSDIENFEDLFIENDLSLSSFKIDFPDGRTWYYPSTIKEIVDEIFDQIADQSYFLISGHTAQGVSPPLFRDPHFQNYISLRGIAELQTSSVSQSGIEVGGNITLDEFLKVLKNARSSVSFGYLYRYTAEIEEHVKLIASLSVRSNGTIAGNLILKYELMHPASGPAAMFNSDIFLLLDAINARIDIVEGSNITNSYTISQFNGLPSMRKKLITKIWFPPLDSSVYKFRSWKVMPKTQNVAGSINAGFLFKMKSPTSTIVEWATIVYGGITPLFTHASQTELALKGANIASEQVLQSIITKLKIDFKDVTDVPPAFPPVYRRQLAINLFYKTVLWLNGNTVNPKYKSGGEKLELSRQLSSGKEDIKTQQSGVRGKPMPKIESFIQCRGEAEFANDIPVIDGQLYAALVLTPQGPGILDAIDPSKALATPGVVTFISAKDIPGSNSAVIFSLLILQPEELFCSQFVKHAGQPVGIIVAKTQDLATSAANLVSVKVVAISTGKPVLSIQDVLNQYIIYPNARTLIQPKLPTSESTVNESHKVADAENENKEEVILDAVTINGEFSLGSQFHFTIEPQTCVAIPKENGEIDLYPSTQWPTFLQQAVASILNIKANKVNVFVRRIGGGFGSKLTRSNFTAGATALAAYLLQKPVRMVMSLGTNLGSIGKRTDLKCFYSLVASKSTGKIILFNKLDFLLNKGQTLNEPGYAFIKSGFVNCYDLNLKSFLMTNYAVLTDLPTSSWSRAQGTLEGFAVIETIMNKIAATINNPNLSPLQVRINNMQASDPAFIKFFTSKMNEINYDKLMADIKCFNRKNRWRKQGLSIVPMKFDISFFFNFYCTVSINAGDGSISISHGGIEMGQGINTKASVAAAYIFGLPDISNISIKQSNVNYTPNNFGSSGSMSSDAVSYACMKACLKIKEQLDILKETLNLPKDIEWSKLIKEAFNNGINLNATFMYDPTAGKDPTIGSLDGYAVCGVCAALAEVDILTGQHIIRHVWLWEDAGESFAPTVDLGQIQGGFIMGMGLFTSENIEYNPTNGRIVSNTSLNYYVPGAKDIPEIFDVVVEDNRDLGGLVNPITGEKKQPPYGVMGAKASDEPSLVLSISVFFAIKEAIKSARQDAGLQETDFTFVPPATIAAKVMSSEINDHQFKITN